MSNDTIKALVVFVNYQNGNYDPINQNSNFIYMQHWPGSQYNQLPSWADSVICPTTTNIWHPSITGLLAQSSNNKFFLIGDVYDQLVLLDHDYQYYSTANGRNIGYAVLDALNEIDPYVDFSQYDKYDPCDDDGDGIRKEKDNKVDIIFMIFRFTVSSITDGSGYTGICGLGGYSGMFADSSRIRRDGTDILASLLGSGSISEMHFKWMIGVPGHEFAQHYGFGFVHHDSLGNHNISGGGIASAHDKEHFGWTSGNIYEPVSNTSNINLRDFVTQGDYLKINRNGKSYYFENRRRLNYYSSNNIHSWRWTINEPLLPFQRDSGLLVYSSAGSFQNQHAFGKWNWKQCTNGRYQILKTPFYNEFIPESVNKYEGLNIMNLQRRSVADEYCNSVYNNYISPPSLVDLTSYIGTQGDSNMCFDIGYNQVYSPWSNPGFKVNGTSDSLTVEITQRNSDGSLNLNVYFNNITQASPSKPQLVKLWRQFIGSPIDAFRPKITWMRNLEPDMMEYKVYRAQITSSGFDPDNYDYVATTSDTFFVDASLLLYRTGGGSGPCARYPIKYAYKISRLRTC
jgi:hypothetical protein